MIICLILIKINSVYNNTCITVFFLQIFLKLFKVLNVAQRYDLMDVVLFYIKYVLVPYYQESLTPACKKVTRAENLTLVGLSFGSHSQSVQLASL